jgi:SPP1 gp7 family putative phage head morphogenesis protein
VSLTSAEYWKQRAEQRESAIWKKAGKFETAIARNATATMDQISRDVASLYARFAKTEGISLAEAYTILDATEMRGIRSRLKSLYKEFSKSGDADIMREISRLSMKSRITRFDDLALSLNASVSRMTGENMKTVEKAVGASYRESRLRFRFDTAKAVGRGNASLAAVPEKAVAKMIKLPLMGKNFSERLWTNKAALISNLKTTLTQSLAGGYSLPKATALFRQGIESGRSSALRIVRTEVANAIETAVKDDYEELGVEQYQFMATLDDSTSDICAALDGEVFNVSDAQEGVNYPPMHPNCYHRDTEVLTAAGFKRFDELTGDEKFYSFDMETGEEGFVAAKKVFRDVPTDKLIHFRHNSFDLMVTPGHKMVVEYVRPDGAGRPRFVDADKLPKSGNRIRRGINWKGEDRPTMKFAGYNIETGLFLHFMAWYLSDGSTTKIKEKNSYAVSIAQKTHIDAMFDELRRLPFPVTKVSTGLKCYEYEVGAGLHRLGKCNVKRIPASIKELSPKWLNIFLDAYSMADGSTKKNRPFGDYPSNEQRSFFTTSKRLADDLAEVISKAGKRPSIHIQKTVGKPCFNGRYKQNFDMYIVRECSTLNAAVENIDRITVPYTDTVFCVELEKWNTLFVKFNGQVTWSGNCRSTTIPYVDGGVASRIARDLETGKSYSMDSYQTYEEWAADNL